MQLTIEKIETVTVVVIPGTTLDASNTKGFKGEVASLLTSGAHVIFDLRNLKFVDSSGLGAMLSSLRQINSLGGDLKLCAMNKPVRALIELVRMHRVFEIFNTREEALRSFGLVVPDAAQA
ncbi:MAG: anti-sigma factor antagonist [Bryobacterales bacterium]|jgi:anti-sigma B factor antagonist|nr:anti-sigma factor antagonist [Bryobacterales bacterium]